MMTGDDINAAADRVLKVFRRAYGVRATRLDVAVKRIGRRLPKRLRESAMRIHAAQKMNGNPKLLRRVDPGTLAQAEQRVTAHLATKDRSAERRVARQDWVARTAFYVLVVFGSAIAILAVRGTL